MKIFLFIFLSFSFLNADYLLSVKNKCILDYYYSNSYIYYHYSSSPKILQKSFSKNYQNYIFSGFTYDPNSNICKKNQYLGLSYYQYNFLYGLFGFFLGFIILWLVPKRS